MRTLSPSEKRTVRIAAAVLGTSLVLLCGQKTWKFLASQRADYTRLVAEADNLRAELKPYQGRVENVQALMEKFRLDPGKLSRTSVVAEASAAILKTTTGGGVQLGPIRETAARQSNKELSSIQLDCTGQVPALMGFLHRFESIGYPIIVESVQLSADPSKPGNLKMHLGIIILDFEQWKAEDTVPHA